MPELNPSVENQTEATPVTEAPAPAAQKAPKPKAAKPATKKAVPKAEKPAKPAPVKKSAVKKEKTETVKKEKKGPRDRTSDKTKTPLQRMVIALKGLRSLSAVNAGAAVNIERLAKKSGLSEFDTFVATYKNHRLQVEGYIKQVKVEGVRGSAFHLTAKGQKGDPE